MEDHLLVHILKRNTPDGKCFIFEGAMKEFVGGPYDVK
jgi:hypothetical protein